MSNWQAEAMITDEFPHWAKPATLDVDPRSGSVELQRRNANGDWESFETFGAAGAYKIDVVNCAELRISANADALFRWTWNG